VTNYQQLATCDSSPDRDSRNPTRHNAVVNNPKLDNLRRALAPVSLHVFPSLPSTNTHAAAMIERGELVPPAAVLAERQTAGRGRGTNAWWSGAGSLTVTFCYPGVDVARLPLLPLAAGLAVRQVAAEASGKPAVALKWPNDVLLDGRKLAGILCERVRDVDLVGIGLNVNCRTDDLPPELRESSACLATGPDPLDLDTVLLALTRALETWRTRLADPAMVETYNRHHALTGRVVQVASPGEPALTGRCEGIDADGRLLVRTPDGLRRILAGQVRIAD
jgi:BirA family biotin operon repressor/biotin-[acetyl-CoA-carboxylase] ligase